jgi:hypothetical protein
MHLKNTGLKKKLKCLTITGRYLVAIWEETVFDQHNPAYFMVKYNIIARVCMCVCVCVCVCTPTTLTIL